MPIAVLASVGPPTIPEKTKQSIIDRRSSAAGERQISNLLGPAETVSWGDVRSAPFHALFRETTATDGETGDPSGDPLIGGPIRAAIT